MAVRTRIWHTNVTPELADRDALVIEVDEPTLDNTGSYAIPGVLRSVINGSGGSYSITSSGQTFSDVDFNCRVNLSGVQNTTFIRCDFKGFNGAPTAISNIVASTNVNNLNNRFIDCTFGPQFEHRWWQVGIAGHGYKLIRCQFNNLVDGINVVRSGGNPTNVEVTQCYFGPMAWWSAPSGGVVHNNDTETHNDCIQHMGGTGTLIRGNAFHARYVRQYGHWHVTDPGSEPYATVTLNSLPDGGPYQAIPSRTVSPASTIVGDESNGRYNWDDLSCLMIGDEVGTTTGLRFWGNWCYGGVFPVNGGGNARNGVAVSLGTFYRNRFDMTSGGYRNTGIDRDTLNFQGGSWSGFVDAPTTGADANVFMGTGDPVTVRGA